MLTLQPLPMKRLSELHDLNSDIKRLWPETRINGPDRAGGSLIPLSPDQETLRLREAVDQLDAALEKANRRINRLLGEKKQLSNVLDKRDSQLERLNRELGASALAKDAVSTRSHRTPGLRDRLKVTLMSLTKCIRTLAGAHADARGITVGNDQPEAPAVATNKPKGLLSRRRAEIEQPVIAVLLFGLARDEIEQLLPIIERDCSEKRMVPLCLIDLDAFELLRDRDLIFEYLPPASDQDRFDPDLNWNLYTQRRLALIRRKWDPVRLVAFGATAMKTLTLWSSSPFEDTPLPAASSPSTENVRS